MFYRGRHRLRRPFVERLMLSGALVCFASAGFATTIYYQDLPVATPAYLALPAVTATAPVVQPLVVSTTPEPTATQTATQKLKKRPTKAKPAPVVTVKSSDTFGGVKPHVAAVGNYLKAKFDLDTVFGNAPRPGNKKSDHPKGLALDLMVGKDRAKGNRIHDCVEAHREEWGVTYTIWQEPEHYNHVHVSFKPNTEMPKDLSC